MKGLLSLEKGDRLCIPRILHTKLKTIKHKPTTQAFIRSTVDMSKAPITFIHWICTIPGGKNNVNESLCTLCSNIYGLDSVVVVLNVQTLEKKKNVVV